MPGAEWKRKAARWRTLTDETIECPYADLKKKMVRPFILRTKHDIDTWSPCVLRIKEPLPHACHCKLRRRKHERERMGFEDCRYGNVPWYVYLRPYRVPVADLHSIYRRNIYCESSKGSWFLLTETDWAIERFHRIFVLPGHNTLPRSSTESSVGIGSCGWKRQVALV